MNSGQMIYNSIRKKLGKIGINSSATNFRFYCSEAFRRPNWRYFSLRNNRICVNLSTMDIKRILFSTIKDKLSSKNKIIILYGARQVGKTTLINEVLDSCPNRILRINADELKYLDVLSSRDLRKIRGLVDGYDVLFIDEAQRIPEIGINLKIIHDQLPQLRVIATGSSSFDLANKVQEPLTGRAWTYTLYPISFLELAQHHNSFELAEILEQCLIYGQYPEQLSIVNNNQKYQYLKELATSYLYRDALDLVHIKHADKLHNLLRLLAFQVGSLVSVAELATSLNLSKDTVSSYIQLLEKAFIIFRLKGYSRNLRKEITKMDKIYFYDLGVRNMVIDNLQPLANRNDQGALWENFLILERRKLLSYRFRNANTYFWRTYTGAELDYLEERDAALFGYEFKYNNKTPKAPKTWGATYPEAQFASVNVETYLEFITEL